MSSVALILFGLLVQCSYGISVWKDSFWSLGSLDDMDPSPDISNIASGANNFYSEGFSGANSMEYESDIDILAGSSETSSESNDLLPPMTGSGLVIGDNFCSTTDGQSQKRDGVTCPAETSPSVHPLELPTLPGVSSLSEDDKPKRESWWDDDEPIPRLDDDDDKGRCPGEIIGMARKFYLTCDGPFGPYRLDPYGRMIFDYIKSCDPGTFSFPPFVVVWIDCITMTN